MQFVTLLISFMPSCALIAWLPAFKVAYILVIYLVVLWLSWWHALLMIASLLSLRLSCSLSFILVALSFVSLFPAIPAVCLLASCILSASNIVQLACQFGCFLTSSLSYTSVCYCLAFLFSSVPKMCLLALFLSYFPAFIVASIFAEWFLAFVLYWLHRFFQVVSGPQHPLWPDWVSLA